MGGGSERRGGGGWSASRSRWAIYRPLSSSPSSSASSTMSTCSSVGKERSRMHADHVCARQLCRVIATAYPSPIFWLIDDSQFRRYYQIRTALRVSPKLPVKVEVNQLRNREYFFPVSSTFPEECLQFILRIATLLRITFLQVKFTSVKFVFFSRCNDSKIRLIRLSFRSKMLI